MKKNTFISIFLVGFLLLSNFSFAQGEEPVKENPFGINLSIMSRYVWRGQDFGAAPSIQPGISYSKWGLTLGSWGAYTCNNVNSNVQEFDLYLSYSFLDMFSVTVTDYFFPDESADYKYFDYKDHSTGHVFEGTIAFNGTEKLPLSAFIATNLYGCDARRMDQDKCPAEIQYSTYAELAYSFKYVSLFMGFNLTEADTENGESGYYGDSFGVVNLGISVSKAIKITENFSLPVSASLITNPQKEKVFFVVGINL
jgi:hypothetical protein